MKLRVLDLFSGIGGFSLGLERTGGFETVAFCEIEEYPRRVLAKHWPKVPCYDDVRTLTADRLAADGIAVDVICGGFPCQDISFAGRRAGLEGARSGLWGEYARLIGELRPRFVVVENVPGLLVSGWEPFSETFPRSGTMRSGTVCPLPPSAPLTGETEYGSWPTPQAMDGNKGNQLPRPWDTGVSLPQRVAQRMWPTPTATDGPASSCANVPVNGLLGRAVHLDETTTGGSLNPTWVEWLQGFPLEWTALNASEMPSSRRSRNSSAARYSKQKGG